jgi:hypothetical protein
MPTPKLPELDTSRGSPMGRPPWPRKTPCSEGLDITQTECFKAPAYCFRVRLCQGYDSGGAYWGGPNDLWCATNGFDGDETFQMFARAYSRAEAQSKFEYDAPGLITWHKRSPRPRRLYERR